MDGDSGSLAGLRKDASEYSRTASPPSYVLCNTREREPQTFMLSFYCSLSLTLVPLVFLTLVSIIVFTAGSPPRPAN